MSLMIQPGVLVNSAFSPLGSWQFGFVAGSSEAVIAFRKGSNNEISLFFLKGHLLIMATGLIEPFMYYLVNFWWSPVCVFTLSLSFPLSFSPSVCLDVLSLGYY